MSIDKLSVAFRLGRAVGITESIEQYDRSRWAQEAASKAWADAFAVLNDAYNEFSSEEYATLLRLLQQAREGYV